LTDLTYTKRYGLLTVNVIVKKHRMPRWKGNCNYNLDYYNLVSFEGIKK
jgi:hypothetical protein